MKLNKYLNESKNNDMYKQLLYLADTLNDVIKMMNIKVSMDYLDMKRSETKELKKMIIKLNLILNSFDKNVKTKKL